jgi:hypothetical protein
MYGTRKKQAISELRFDPDQSSLVKKIVTDVANFQYPDRL